MPAVHKKRDAQVHETVLSGGARSAQAPTDQVLDQPMATADAVVDGDLLDRVFDRVCSLSSVVTEALLKSPDLAREVRVDPELLEVVVQYVIATIDAERPHVRAEFGGERGWIRKSSPVDRAQLERDILTLFNGRNASEVARRLGIGRATVYRIIRQPGRGPRSG